MRLTNFLKR